MMPEGIVFSAVAAELLLSGTILIVLLLDAFRERPEPTPLAAAAGIGVLVALLATFGVPAGDARFFSGLIYADQLRNLLWAALLGATGISLVMSLPYLKHNTRVAGEYLILLLSAVLGMGVMVSTTHLGLMFLALEMLSLPLYALTAFRWQDVRSSEGALKYFLLGSVAGAMFLLGAALIFGRSGTFDIIVALERVPADDFGMAIGLAFLLVGVAFKLAWVPFHSWSPDAYEAAPLPVTGFMSVTVKLAVVGAAIRVLYQAGAGTEAVRAGLWGFAAITMIGGNLLAVVQTNFKRMLAYSSIAHAGYIGVALYAGNALAIPAAIFYLIVYGLMNLGAFGALIALSRRDMEIESFDDLRGLGRHRGGMALLVVLLFMSLSGIPPLAGFAAKLFVFHAAVEAGAVGLVVIGVLTSAVGAYYYLRPLVVMYLLSGEPRTTDRVAPSLIGVLTLIVGVLLWLGIKPAVLMDVIRQAAAFPPIGG